MATLVIPDIHNQTDHADYWLQTQRYDRVVFLGDYFDSEGDSPHIARRTALWLRKRIENTKDVFLIGNHDIAYMFPKTEALICTGFSKEKARSIRAVLGPEHWSRLKFAHAEQGWLLSHAGFHPTWVENPSQEWILKRAALAMKRVKKKVIDPLLGVGQDRGGAQKHGGPLWMDWENFRPIPGINQIVGHTSGLAVRKKSNAHSKNFCIDVRGTLAAAIIYEGWHKILTRDLGEG